MRYVFADCVLDTALATLHRAGRAIPLRPKVFHLLQYLPRTVRASGHEGHALRADMARAIHQ
jgi:DNA-binding winged helix-turn-helix (wHTH) protein